MRIQRVKLPGGRAVSCINRAEALHSHGQMDHYFRHGVRVGPDDVVVDVGANIGLFMLAIHWRCPEARVYAFEPIPYTFEALRRNARRYDVGGEQLLPFNRGLSDHAGDEIFSFFPRMTVMSNARSDDMRREFERLLRELPLLARAQPKELGWRILAALPQTISGAIMRGVFGFFTRAEEIRCRVRPLSEVLRELEIPWVDLLKIDVERAELQVLEGIEDQHWPRIRQLVVEIHDQDGRLDRIRELLARRGFTRLEVDQEPQFRGTLVHHLYAFRE